LMITSIQRPERKFLVAPRSLTMQPNRINRNTPRRRISWPLACSRWLKGDGRVCL
jgi:hypothetical protein